MDLPTQLNLLGGAPVFLEAVDLIKRFAACDATVLLQGETGTGKELAARAIHYLGARRDFPFIPVNCGALPDNLIENEFFGHARGAFTDAQDTQCGLVTHAEGGTLFLDEIECLSPKGQVVLLRFLQDQVYRPLGSRRQIVGNVRVIAASNADVSRLVREGVFRADLMYRLAIMSVTMPPLRDRPGDALLLANHFIARFARQYGRPRGVLDEESVAQLEAHSWPGNVRELENVIHRGFLIAESPLVQIRLSSAAFGPAAQSPSPTARRVPFELGFSRAKALAVAEFEKAFLARAMAESGGNVSRAARLAGKERRAFGKLLKKHGIDGTTYRDFGAA